MITRLLLAAIAAGLIAGALISVLQVIKVTPLIHAAEVYEMPTGVMTTHTHRHGESAGDGQHHDSTAWMPEDGYGRLGLTVLTNIVTGAGFGLLLAAAIAFRGLRTTWREGVIWGIGGYLAFSLLPSLGLPPELPGMSAGDLGARQTWWLTAVSGSAAGLALIAFSPNWALRVLGLIVLLMPHAIGAPPPYDYTNDVPAEMAAQFVTASLVTTAMFWAVLGACTGHFVGRGIEESAAA